MEPICGEGMGNALCSAEIAVEALLNPKGGANRDGLSLDALSRSVIWSLRSAACRAGGIVAASPSASRVALSGLQHFRLGAVMLWVVGKN